MCAEWKQTDRWTDRQMAMGWMPPSLPHPGCAPTQKTKLFPFIPCTPYPFLHVPSRPELSQGSGEISILVSMSLTGLEDLFLVKRHFLILGYMVLATIKSTDVTLKTSQLLGGVGVDQYVGVIGKERGTSERHGEPPSPSKCGNGMGKPTSAWNPIGVPNRLSSLLAWQGQTRGCADISGYFWNSMCWHRSAHSLCPLASSSLVSIFTDRSPVYRVSLLRVWGQEHRTRAGRVSIKACKSPLGVISAPAPRASPLIALHRDRQGHSSSKATTQLPPNA